MRAFFRCTLLALPLLSGAIAEQPSTQTDATSIYANAHEAFQDLLNALPEESLQAALNGLTKFKAGVFESHRRGVERVHDSSPALATKLIVAAVQDLKKRQVGAPANGTTSAAPSQTPDQPQSSAQDSQPVQPPSSSPPDNTPPSSSPPQTSAADTPAATAPSTPSSRPVLIPVEVTTTDTAGSTVAVTTQEVRPAVIRTTTDSRGSSVAVTSAANYAPTRGEVLTTTNDRGSTFLTTYTPGGGRVSSVRLVTTTDAQGRPLTSTAITYVDPTDVAGDGGPSGGEATRTANPSVQSGAANRHNAALAGLAGLGAFAVFF